jgi:hypothetical protein
MDNFVDNSNECGLNLDWNSVYYWNKWGFIFDLLDIWKQACHF